MSKITKLKEGLKPLRIVKFMMRTGHKKTSRPLPIQTHTFSLHLLIVLLLARILAELAVRLKAPSVIGELMAGVVLGPSLFDG